MEKILFALMGCGRIAGKHASAIRDLPNAELVAVCDPQQDRAKKIAEEYGAAYYSTIQELVKQHPDVQVVNILTPSGNHAQHTIEVAQLGKHVVVEKPMALTISDADSMIHACSQQGVKLFVVKQNRYNAPIMALRNAIDEGRFGRLIMGTIRVRWCRKQDYYDQDAWRGTWAMDGGVLTNQASHHVDLLEWMMGDVISVFAKAKTQLVNIETEDTAVAILNFRNGALGVIEATTATRPTDLEGSISILGEKGTVEIGGFAVNQIKTWQFAESKPEDKDVAERCAENPENVYGFGHKKYLADVVASIVEDIPAFVDGLEGRKSLELINALYESIETAREIPMRFQPKHCRLGLQGTVSEVEAV